MTLLDTFLSGLIGAATGIGVLLALGFERITGPTEESPVKSRPITVYGEGNIPDDTEAGR